MRGIGLMFKCVAQGKRVRERKRERRKDRRRERGEWRDIESKKRK